MSWVAVLAAFLVAHMVGDYLLQTDWQARHKRGGLGNDPVARRALVTHVTTYTLAFLPALIWIGSEIEPVWALVAGVLIFLPHLLIDDGRVGESVPRPRQTGRRAEHRPGGVGRPVLPRALAVLRRAAGGRGVKAPGLPRRLLLLFAAALIAVGMGALFQVAGLMSAVERGSVDTRFDVRGAQDPPADVVLVDIDTRTAGDEDWPINRTHFAKAITRALAGGRGRDRARRPDHRGRAPTRTPTTRCSRPWPAPSRPWS